MSPDPTAPSSAKDAVLVRSEEMPEGSQKVEELDFNKFRGRPITADDLYQGMRHMGFQASSMCEAVRIINDMRAWRGEPEADPEADPESEEAEPTTGDDSGNSGDSGSGTDRRPRTTIFLGYTSNLISSGLRGVLRYLVEHRHVSAVVTTAGGIEEDFIKCLGDTYMSPGGFSAVGKDLRARGLNRIGNLVVPNSNYCAFEDWVVPIMDRMFEEQEASRAEGTHLDSKGRVVEGELNWTPSKVIARLGREINNESSVYYWAWKNDIPVFCPALTDGSLGDMLYFHTFKTSPQQLRIDIVEDIRKINTIAVRAERAGMIILGGGLVKHHIANACLMRNGAESAVYINTAQEFDGSDAGARPDEAVSWGKIKAGADSVKVYMEATAAFPFIVANTFAKEDETDKA